MIRRMGTSILVGALVLATTALVVYAIRPSSPPRAPQAAINIGALTVSGDSMWRWSGPTECTPDTNIIQVEQRTGDGSWTGNRIPLANVYSLSFLDSSHGIATGTTASCSRGVALTADGGRTWRYREDNPVLFDAWWVGTHVWGIEQATGPPQIKEYTVRDSYRLVPVPGETLAAPCDARDGVPSQVAFYTDDLGLLLCQQQLTGERLIARTTNAGETFERLVDSRPATGLDGDAKITALDVAGAKTAWALFTEQTECEEGQIRRTDSQGAVWDRLPCPSESVDVDLVLDIAFTSVNDGIMLGVTNGSTTTFTTDDGGKSWH